MERFLGLRSQFEDTTRIATLRKMRPRRNTKPFRDEAGKVLAGSIAEAKYLRLGGLDQWVMIRGESRDNPALILLYGGPGFSETTFFRYFNQPLEKSFTVVYWDQRGSAKSFYRNLSRADMTVEQFLTDLDELVDYVRERLGKEKVTILGHSWGSQLGVLYAARHPEKVAAYVGAAQIGDPVAAESQSYAIALAQAERLRNEKALKQLRAMGPPPYDAKAVMTERTWLQRMDGQLRGKALWNMIRMVLGAPESSLFDLRRVMRGFWFSLDAMLPEVSRLNMMKLVPKLTMPVFFFLGREDHWVPPETSVAYFDALAAPSKKLVWFENAGHEVFADEPAKFNGAMIEMVRPLTYAA